MQRDLTILLDLVQAAQLIQAFKEGMNRAAFEQTERPSRLFYTS